MPIMETPVELRRQNELALRQALSWLTLLPWGICFCFYLTLGFVYARDRDRASAAHEAASRSPAKAKTVAP